MALNYQLDIPLTGPNFYTLPKFSPGRLITRDFIYFKWCPGFPADQYSVIVETLDITQENPFRRIGPLMPVVELPFVHFGFHVRIAVIHNTDRRAPRFVAELDRGVTYDIPSVTKQGTYQMEKFGVAINSF